jgi:hypothetical protein
MTYSNVLMTNKKDGTAWSYRDFEHETVITGEKNREEYDPVRMEDHIGIAP